jgi:hypothetical protein
MAAVKPKGLGDAPETAAIRALTAEAAQQLVITWKGGAESIVDVSDLLSRFAVFAPLRSDPNLFKTARVGEWGWCAHWSDEIEISADTLWRLALEQGAAWLRTWRAAHGMTQAEASKALGVGPRMWRYYEAGTHLLPKTVRLAAIGLDAQAKAA